MAIFNTLAKAISLPKGDLNKSIIFNDMKVGLVERLAKRL
jgi:hypothetical protein